MNADLTEKLNEILSDPDKLSAVMGAVSGMMGQSGEKQGAEPTEVRSPLASLPINIPSDDRIKLLEAVKPFVSDEKKQRVDKLIRMMTLGSLAGTFKNLL